MVSFAFKVLRYINTPLAFYCILKSSIKVVTRFNFFNILTINILYGKFVKLGKSKYYSYRFNYSSKSLMLIKRGHFNDSIYQIVQYSNDKIFSSWDIDPSDTLSARFIYLVQKKIIFQTKTFFINFFRMEISFQKVL